MVTGNRVFVQFKKKKKKSFTQTTITVFVRLNSVHRQTRRRFFHSTQYLALILPRRALIFATKPEIKLFWQFNKVDWLKDFRRG